MGNLSEHFNHQDFFCGCEACRTIKEYKIHLGLVGVLEALVVKLNKPVKIKMAYRCEAENERLGGGRKSFHLKGKAVHVYVDGIKPQDLFKHIREMEDVKGIGLNLEEGTVHIDMRNMPEREEWVKEKGKYIPLTPDKKHNYGLE
ncbi:MAG: D-Ala-D-Ala carboxypeptidase family metallohydrolase [bacterium]